jgi:hypothetical protein
MGSLRTLTWRHVLLVAAVFAGCGELIALTRMVASRAAEQAPSNAVGDPARRAHRPAVHHPHGLSIIGPLLAYPIFDDIVALVAAVGVALTFALKDSVSCIVDGVVTVRDTPRLAVACRIYDRHIAVKVTPNEPYRLKERACPLCDDVTRKFSKSGGPSGKRLGSV